MKLMIRFADKIVGVSIILALGIILFVLFMLGSNQRWFSRDYVFLAYFDSAVGISPNMPVQHIGFTIGQVRSVRLTEDDRVEVRFIIFDTFIDRARVGSLIELVASPIPGFGANQLLFFPGFGQELLSEWDVIPLVGSPDGERLVEMGLAAHQPGDDGIGAIVGSVASLLYILNEAMEGTERTTLGRTLRNIEDATAELHGAVRDISAGIGENLDSIMEQAEGVIANLGTLSEGIAAPDGAIMSILDGEGEVHASLVTSLQAVSGILRHLETTTGYIPAQLPQVTAILLDLQVILRNLDDVLVAAANNPLLRRGVPERRETGPGGAFDRDMEF
ncbi:MAG: MlaD family protein [Treponema sp.]|nr:MlaD family protein [Treponema sp.]